MYMYMYKLNVLNLKQENNQPTPKCLKTIKIAMYSYNVAVRTKPKLIINTVKWSD